MYVFHIEQVRPLVNENMCCIMKRYTILVVDDEKHYADMLVRRLTLRGIASHACYDGGSALDTLKRTPIPVVILDLRLPDMYGLDVLKNIKADIPETVVIILTGHGSEKDRQQSMAMGAHAFMNKPVDIDRIMNIVSKCKAIAL